MTIASLASWALASDHADGPATTAKPDADITDLYAWPDADRVVLVMNVHPAATTSAKLATKTAYVFHVESAAAYGEAGDKLDILCTFDQAQRASCWAGNRDYVSGDAGAEGGLSSTSGMMKIFAGLRDDPSFIHRAGLDDAFGTVASSLPSLTKDAAGCPTIDVGTVASLVTKLSTDPSGGPAVDAHAGQNVLSIVVSLDRAKLLGGGPIVSVWASTNQVGG